MSHIFEQKAASQPERMIPARLLEKFPALQTYKASYDFMSPSLDFVALVQKWALGGNLGEQQSIFGSWLKAEGIRASLACWCLESFFLFGCAARMNRLGSHSPIGCGRG